MIKIQKIVKFLGKSNKPLNFLPINIINQSKRFYIRKEIDLRNERFGYYLDPNEVARRFIKLICMNNRVQNRENITLGSKFYEHGIDDFTFTEILIEAEQEFFLQFPDEEVERFKTVDDVVEFVARSFYSK